MDEVFGLIDALEMTILEGKKVPFSDKVILEEPRILQLIDKIRMVIKDGNLIKRSIDMTKKDHEPQETRHEIKSETVLNAPQTPTDEAGKIVAGAHEYADYVMANLQLLVTKMQSNLVKAEKTITESRALLEKKQRTEKEEN